MRLIDADKLSKNTKKLVENAPTVNILEDIKEELRERYPKNWAGEPELAGNVCHFSLNELIGIIDKHIKEYE